MLLWALFSWPLARHFTSAIPATERSGEGGPAVRSLVAGDHLQLLYHFWLARDMLAGRTPPFANIYEFNVGDDHAHVNPSPYYIPFSLIYAAFAPLAGDAAGWNLAGLAAVLLGICGSFALARRFTRRTALALTIALAANAFPYRWITLLGGSPTGFAMGLLPWLWLGLDVAVRDRRPAGGWLAGASLLAAYCADLHVFYFGALAAPVWCALAWCAAPTPLRPDAARLRALARALWPALALALTAAALSVATSRHLAATDMAGGRDWRTIKLFSPSMAGFCSWRLLAMTNHLFFGVTLAALLGCGLAGRLLAAAGRARQSQLATDDQAAARPWLLITLLLAGICLVAALALGANGPLDGLAMRAARKLIPKYPMIRQSVKVYCLMPALLTVLAALLFSSLPSWRGGGARLWRLLALLLALLTVAEYRLQLRPALCALPERMPAYSAAVAHAAARQDKRPHAVALPLWPGEAHWSSVYEYGITHSRLRLVNGYSPSVPERYHEEVFQRFESLNQGALDPAQADALRAMGVRYLIFHEQPYPERVSPFPAAIALRRLLQHELLEPVAQDGQMWCFFLRDAPRAAAAIPPLWGAPLYGAALHWPFAGRADAATRRTYPLRPRAPVAAAPAMRYLLRVAGTGSLSGGEGLAVTNDNAAARWIEAPFAPPFGAIWSVAAGAPRIEHALLTAGAPPRFVRRMPLRWAAADLFHNGATDAADGSVRLDPARDPQGVALHGPNLPLPPGRWRARLLTAPGADDGGEIGRFVATVMGDTPHYANVPVLAGEPAVCEFTHDGVMPLRLEFHYHRGQPVKLLACEVAGLP